MAVKDKKPIGFCSPYQNLDRSLIDPSLGSDCIRPEEVMKERPDIIYSEQQLKDYEGSFPNTSMLYMLKLNGYCLIPQPPFPSSLLDMYDLKPNHFKVRDRGWYEDRSYTMKDKTGVGWLAIKKHPIEESMGKEWEKQKHFLLPAEYVPNVAQIGWAMIVFWDARDEILFKNVGVRSSSLYPASLHVIIDNLNSEKGIAVMEGQGLAPDSRWGIAPAWKL